MFLLNKVFEIPDEKAMENLGGAFCQALGDKPGILIYLSGDLGAGKTTFVRGFLRALNYQGIVKSPTYTLVEPYELQARKIFHFDFYRLNSGEELEWFGVRDYFMKEYFCLIEWPEKAQNQLPTPDLNIQIRITDNIRSVKIEATSERGKNVLQALSH